MKNLLLSFVFFIIFLLSNSPCYSVQSGQIEYTVPIDYSFINESVLNNESEQLFSQYMNTEDTEQKKALLEQLLSNYSILSKINKDNPLYFVRLGIIYDKLGKDRYAKSNFCRGSNLLPDYAYAFYAFGNYFFDRFEYKKALREYLRAYNYGYNTHYDNLYHIGIIYEKFGDYTSAIKYFKNASMYNNNEELTNKILKLEELLEINSLYNQKKGLYK